MGRLFLLHELRRADPAVMRWYMANRAEHSVLCDALRIPRFDASTRTELRGLLGSDSAVDRIEQVARLGNYGNTNEIEIMRRSLSRALKKAGRPGPRGKRTRPGLSEMVADLVPALLFFGLPMASSERSKIVRVLRIIAEHFGIDGDPRDTLRALRKVNKKATDATIAAILEAVRRGLSSPAC